MDPDFDQRQKLLGNSHRIFLAIKLSSSSGTNRATCALVGLPCAGLSALPLCPHSRTIETNKGAAAHGSACKRDYAIGKILTPGNQA
jgi:hypothetical protein